MAQLTQQQYQELKNKGLTDQKIELLAKQKGFTLPTTGDTGLAGIATGVVKGGLEIARGTAQLVQGTGQRALAALTPSTLGEVKARTGFKSLDDSTPEGQAVSKMLKSKSGEEVVGKVIANVASFFIPTSKATQIAGRVAQGAGKGVSRFGVGVSAQEAPLLQAYKAKVPLAERIGLILRGTEKAGKPILTRDTALRQGLAGTESMIGVQAKRGSEKLWKTVISPALKQTKETVHMPSFINELKEEVRLIPDLTRRAELETALSAFSDDFGKVGKITLEKLQQFKEGWAKFLPDKVYKGKPISGSFREIQNMAAQLARNKIYNVLGDEVRAAYFDYGNLLNLQELGQKALTKGKFKGGAGSFISGVLDEIMTPIASTGGLTLYKIGKGLEFVGTQGLKTVGQIFGL